MPSTANDPIDSWVALRMDTDGHRPLLQGTLLRTAGEALADIPKTYPGMRVLSSRLSPNRVEILLDMGRCDEDLPRLVQAFKRRVRSLAENDDALWQRDHVEWLGADPAQRVALRDEWPGVISG